MKIRSGFVSNSSSSSFICITAGNKVIYGDDYEVSFETETMSINIDTLIKELQEAKDSGEKRITIQYGGGYND